MRRIRRSCQSASGNGLPAKRPSCSRSLRTNLTAFSARPRGSAIRRRDQSQAGPARGGCCPTSPSWTMRRSASGSCGRGSGTFPTMPRFTGRGDPLPNLKFVPFPLVAALALEAARPADHRQPKLGGQHSCLSRSQQHRPVGVVRPAVLAHDALGSQDLAQLLDLIDQACSRWPARRAPRRTADRAGPDHPRSGPTRAEHRPTATPAVSGPRPCAGRGRFCP